MVALLRQKCTPKHGGAAAGSYFQEAISCCDVRTRLPDYYPTPTKYSGLHMELIAALEFKSGKQTSIYFHHGKLKSLESGENIDAYIVSTENEFSPLGLVSASSRYTGQAHI